MKITYFKSLCVLEIVFSLLLVSGCASDQQYKSPPVQSLQPTTSNISSGTINTAPSPVPPDKTQKASTDSLSTDAGLAVVKSLRANLREQPNKSSVVVEEVRQGESLKLVSRSPVGAWYRVRHNETGNEGWVHGNGIVVTNATTTEARKPQTLRKEDTESATKSTPSVSPEPGSGRSYINVDGDRIPSPVFSKTAPAGASARCQDGSYSFSQHRSGTCSHHGGVAEWL